MEYIPQIVIGIIVNLISAVIIYYTLEKRIKKFADSQRIKSYVKGVLSEINYIEHVSIEITSKKEWYFDEKKTPHIDFPTNSLALFISEAMNILSKEDIDKLILFRELLNLTNNFLYKLRNVNTNELDKEKVLNILIPNIKNDIPNILGIVKKLSTS